MMDHIMQEMIGHVGRVEQIEARQGRGGFVPIISAIGSQTNNEVDELGAEVLKLAKCVETMQGQIEWIMDKFEEWNVEE